MTKQKKELIIPVNKKTVDVGNIDINQLADAREQHKVYDETRRSTVGHDYDQIGRDAENLLMLRVNLEGENRLADYDSVGRRMYPIFAEKYPSFFKNIGSVEIERLQEYAGVMRMMIKDLQDVAAGKKTMSESRNALFEETLAKRYVKKKDDA